MFHVRRCFFRDGVLRGDRCDGSGRGRGTVHITRAAVLVYGVHLPCANASGKSRARASLMVAEGNHTGGLHLKRAKKMASMPRT